MQSSISKKVIITGCNKGVGFGILENLAQKLEKHHFIMAVRSKERGQEAVDELSKLVPDIQKRVDIHELDVSDEKSRNTFVDTISKAYGKEGIDCLINNAGTASKGDNFDGEVVQTTFQTNYYGTVDLTDKLKPYIAPNGKIITIGSSTGKLRILKSQSLVDQFTDLSIDREKLNYLAKKFYDDVVAGTYEQNGWPKQGYAMSKLCINTFAKILGRDEDIIKKDIQVYVCCPGWVRTDMTGPKASRSIQEGALCPVALFDFPWKIDQKLQGQFFYDGQITPL